MTSTADIICEHILLSELKPKKMHKYIWNMFRIRLGPDSELTFSGLQCIFSK